VHGPLPGAVTMPSGLRHRAFDATDIVTPLLVATEKSHNWIDRRLACSRRWSLTVATTPITAAITAGSPMLTLGMSPSRDTTNEFTRPVKAVIASASPPGVAFGPKIESSRTETATNNRPMSAAEAVAAAPR
jgi:hypothetical protein